MVKVMRTVAAIICVTVLVGLALPPVAARTPSWVEPRALNIVDIAGQVPDSVLDGNILVYGSGGIMQFMSSRQEGGDLIIRTRVYPRRVWDPSGQWVTTMPLLGQRPIFDHPGSVAPESWLRLWYGGSEVTHLLTGAWLSYSAPCLCGPEVNSGAAERHPSRARFLSGLTVEAKGVPIPANLGGECNFFGDYYPLEAEFRVGPQVSPRVTYLSEQRDTFQSYIGIGGVGAFQGLMDQMMSRYGWRHPRLALWAPAEANYVLFTYPPMPYDPNQATQDNLIRPVAGTVRLALDNGMLSQDLVAGGAYPLRAVWQDADQVLGSSHLSLMPPVDRYTPPEYVLPAGIGYDPCYLEGDCSDGVLQTIYDATMTMRVVYLKVEPPTEGVQFVLLGVADDSWSGQRLSGCDMAGSQPSVLLPLIISHVPSATPSPTPVPTPPVYPTDRPAGLFEPVTGRMVGYLW